MKLNHLFVLIIFPNLALAAEVCQSDVCQKFSTDLLYNSMNHSVDPCDDFYEYICGNYPEHHPLTPEHEKVDRMLTRQQLVYLEVDKALLKMTNSSSKVIQYVSQLYSDCVDESARERRGVRPLIEIAEAVLGGWPMIRKPKLNSTAPRWPDLFADVYSKLGLSFIFNIDSHIEKLRISVGPISLDPTQHDTPSYFISNETVIRNYRTFLHQMVDILGSSESKEKVAKDIEKLIHFEQQVEKIFRETLHHNDNLYGTIAEFNVATENRVDWLHLMNRILDSIKSKKVRYTPTSKVDVSNVRYHKLVTQLLDTTPIDVIQNFFGSVLALNYGLVTTQKLRDAIFAFNANPQYSRFPENCTELVKYWPVALGRIYVDTHFSPHERNDATMLVFEIQASFRANLQTNTWLDSTTKKFAIEKLDAMQEKIGYLDWILNDTILDTVYSTVKEEQLIKGHFLENLVKWRVGVVKDALEELTVAGNLISPDISPIDVNAFYNFIRNLIVIPAGILQAPFFDHEMPWSVNYGAIGVIIGHEMTHGFDSNGRKFDLHGFMKNWWSNDTLTKFNNKTSCIRDQYSAIHNPTVGLNISGERTLGENIADNGGLKEAYGAYKSHLKKMNDAKLLPGLNFTSDQLFFVGYANIFCESISPHRLKEQFLKDAHSPGRYRVNVALGNTPQFAEAFKCPLGSKMNPVEKCSVW